MIIMTDNTHKDNSAPEPRAWLFRGIVALLVTGALVFSLYQRPSSGVRFVAALAIGLYGAVALARFVIMSLRRDH